MIDLLFTFGAVAQSKTLRPTVDDSQDSLTFLKRQVAGSVRPPINRRCLEGSGQIAPWRSL